MIIESVNAEKVKTLLRMLIDVSNSTNMDDVSFLE